MTQMAGRSGGSAKGGRGKGASSPMAGLGSVASHNYSVVSTDDFQDVLTSLEAGLLNRAGPLLSNAGIVMIDAVPESASELTQAAGVLYGDAVRIVRRCSEIRGGTVQSSVAPPNFAMASVANATDNQTMSVKHDIPDFPVVKQDLVGFGIPDAESLDDWHYGILGWCGMACETLLSPKG